MFRFDVPKTNFTETRGKMREISDNCNAILNLLADVYMIDHTEDEYYRSDFFKLLKNFTDDFNQLLKTYIVYKSDSKKAKLRPDLWGPGVDPKDLEDSD